MFISMPLGHIIHHHGLHCHYYADDNQIYTACRPGSIHQTTSLSMCVNELKTWLNSNYISFNLSKSEILITGLPTLTNRKYN